MLTTGAIFSDHMVLQREKTIPVWGYADPREWRSEWKDDKMPFLFVQLPMYIAKAQAVQGIDDRHWAMRFPVLKLPEEMAYFTRHREMLK